MIEVDQVAKHLAALADNGIIIKIAGIELKGGEEVLDWFRTNNVENFTPLCDRYYSLSYGLGLGYDDSKVFADVGYPFTCPLIHLLKGFMKENIGWDEVVHFMELENQLLPKLTTELGIQLDKRNGSQKYQDAAKEFFEEMKKHLEKGLRKVDVGNMSIRYGANDGKWTVCQFDFTDNISYPQKNRIKEYLNIVYFNKFSKVNQNLRHSIFEDPGIMGIVYDDSGKKCRPCKSIAIKIPVGRWESLGLDENAQFVPKMGMKRLSVPQN